MGVRRKDYIVIGVDIGYDKYDDDKFYDYEKYDNYQEGELAYIIDGFNGNYFVIGEIVECALEEDDGFRLHEIDCDNEDIKKAKARVKEHIKEHFNLDINPKLVVFSHHH